MRKTIAAIAAVGLATLSPLSQASPSKQENIGVGTGAIIGGAAGGPVGLIIGAAIGAKIGDSMHGKDSEIATLSASLEQSRSRVAELEHTVGELDGNIDALTSELERMQRVARPELGALLRAGIATDLLFRTGESVLADTTGTRLQELAATVSVMPGIRVRLDGFADERGDEAYNQALSEQRVEFVRSQLVMAGIDDARITTAAHGESPAQDETPDSYALERRVSLTLYVDETPSLAANPE